MDRSGTGCAETGGGLSQQPADVDWEQLAEEVFASVEPEPRAGMTLEDARFLYKKVLVGGHREVTEITRVPGLASALIRSALAAAEAASFIDPPHSLTCIDISGPSRVRHPTGGEVGQVAGTTAVDFHSPAASVEVGLHASAGASLVVVGAHHGHPCPVLDVLSVLDLVRPGGRLIVIGMTWTGQPRSALGVQRLLRGLGELDVDHPDGDDPAGICSIEIPPETEPLRDLLLRTLYDYPWELEPDAGAMRAALGWPAVVGGGGGS